MTSTSKSTPTEIVETIFTLFKVQGTEPYFTEPVNHIEHALQAAALAKEGGYDDEIVLAALLHDVGHICDPTAPHMNSEGDVDVGVVDHEKVGADYLRAFGFSEKVAALVESHVTTKRYLTFIDPEYHANLAEDSIRSLKFQGGPMTPEEAAAFEAQDLPLEWCKQMREWDDLAKKPGVEVPGLETYREMMLGHLVSQAASD